MPSDNEVEIRPRTTGEIMDDAWRLYLSNGPTLLLLSTLFQAPLAMLVLILITTRPPENFLAQLVLPAVTALAVPLTGLGSGACQAAFHVWSEGLFPQGIPLWACLRSAWRNGLKHAAARVVVASLSLVGIVVMVLPGLTVWGGSGPVHPILAGKDGMGGGEGLFHAFQTAGQESQRQPGKALALMLGRGVLLAFAVVNLHTLALVGVWVGESMAGFDWAALTAWLSLRHNPIYTISLVLLAWLLLAPFSEAVNFLFHVDARARYEGLDLWHRARKHFRLAEKATMTSIVISLAALLSCLMPVRGADALACVCSDPLKRVTTARQEITVIRQEVNTKNPFPGGGYWTARLQQIAAQLDPDGNRNLGKYRWFHHSIQDFARHDREVASVVLDDIDQKLGLIEDNLMIQAEPEVIPGPGNRSKEEIKALLPADREGEALDEPQKPKLKNRQKADTREDEREIEVRERQRETGRGMVAPASTSGLNSMAWIVFWGIMLAAGAVAILIARRNWTPRPIAAKAPLVEATKPSLQNLLAHANPRTVAELWQRADDLARKGQFLEAVRSLYLAALILLHRSNLIRFEPTRTNGEYLDQLRSHKPLQDSFRAMTGIFELKWYGQRNCRPEDWVSCRELAEVIRVVCIDPLNRVTTRTTS